jgi:hypothetical protein
MFWILVFGTVLAVAVVIIGIVARQKRRRDLSDELSDTFKFSPPF